MDVAYDQPMATRLTRQALPLHLFASFLFTSSPLHLFASSPLCLFLILLPALPVAAQPPPAPKWSSLEEALGKEDYAAAKKLADAIVQRGTPDDRTKAAAVYGRILLGLGQTDQARQYLAMQAKQGFATQQGAIYAAWLTAQCGKPGEAAQTLEAILRQAGDSPDEAVAEAADVLAMLYMARDDMEKAKQTVEFGLKVLQYRGVKDGYLLALLRGRLASNFTAGAAKRLYDQAEKLRKEGKFQPAGRVYMQVFSLPCSKPAMQPRPPPYARPRTMPLSKWKTPPADSSPDSLGSSTLPTGKPTLFPTSWLHPTRSSGWPCRSG